MSPECRLAAHQVTERRRDARTSADSCPQVSPAVSNLASMAREVGGWFRDRRPRRIMSPACGSASLPRGRDRSPAPGRALRVRHRRHRREPACRHPVPVRDSLHPNSRTFLVLGAFLLIELIFDTVYGQTLGKRLLGIRVIRVDAMGSPASPGWCCARCCSQLWCRRSCGTVIRRGLHDRAAGTVVVVDPNKAQQLQG